MPGNRAIYDRAMQQSRESARQNRWDEALKSAGRALQEFPQEVDARTAVAVALFHTGKLDKALQFFEELRTGDPNNPFFLEYIARTQEGQGNLDAAVGTYRLLADLHQKRKAPARTIKALYEILRLRPDADPHRQRLAELLEETRETQAAAAEYMTLAHRYLQRDLLDRAAASADEALRLDPSSREKKELLASIHEAMAKAAGVTHPEGGSETGASFGALRYATGGLRTQQFTLEKIVASAVEKQQAGDAEGAAKEYERAIEAGLERADVFYSLGLIYQERGDTQAAIKMLTKAATDPEYALSAHFALGESYKTLKKLPQAAQEFESAIRLVDLETIGKAEAEDLIAMYENVVDIYQQMGDTARAASLYSTLAGFLQGKRWGKERAAEFNKRAKELTQQSMLSKLRMLGTGTLGPPPEPSTTPPLRETAAFPETWGKIRPITDFLRADGKIITTGELELPIDQPATDPLKGLEDLPPPEEPAFAPVTSLDTTGLEEHVRRWVLASEKFIEQGFLEAALDACHEVIRLDMAYLPIHLRMGEIYERQKRPKEALTKYHILIDTYMVRDEPERAIDVYYRVIDLSPDVSNVRSRLAELLKRVGRPQAAAEQLCHVAATYFRLGQTNRALEEYRRALQWAPRDKELHTQYGLTLFKIERYESALNEFRKAIELGADDPPSIARINITVAVMGENPRTVWDSLASLLEQIKGQPQVNSEVQSEYRAALMVNDAPVLHYMLGIIQQYSNQHSAALFEFEQAHMLLQSDESPLLPAALVHQAMADSYIAIGKAENALEQLHRCQQAAQELQPDPSIKHPFATPLSHGDLLRRMAEAYAASDDLAGAERALEEARRFLPYDRAVYTKLADVYFRQGRLAEAVGQLEDLATYYEEHQHLDHAIETLQDALKLAPNHIPVGSRLARLYIRRGYPDKGMEGLVRVAEQQRRAGQLKDAVSSLQQAAEILVMQGKQEEVRSIYDKIVQIAPDDVEARQWLAIMHTLAFRMHEAVAEKKEIVRIFAKHRDYENAIAELHQIIGLNQKDTEAYYLLGDMLMRRGEYAQAVQLYKRMLKMEEVDIERIEALLAAASRMLDQQKVGAG
ncbi:MAG: tetratricopeptide repeat protein [Chloroflexaceae bacterium]|nr:tetratricopeptide repeat protein [Chloroflexaceae bacterium]